tara:strand:+ start:315 stop:1049 length:735 start_codon:yes stop_codon:yes gene_type:complete
MIKTTLLTSGNQKILKGEKLGYITKGIHLAPANLSGYEVCQWRSKGCTMACLNTAGRGQMQRTQDSRVAKTKLFFEERFDFLAKLSKEIISSVKSASKKSMQAVFRPNLTSDIAWENIINEDGVTIFEKHGKTQFYDYTKSFKRMCAFLGKPFIKGEKFPSNYHLTFSRSEHNDTKCEMVLAMGGNVAVVFRNQLPKTWKGFEVVNGDETDLRFLDKKGVVVGLIEKGLAKKDSTGFVQEGIDS